MDFPDFFKYPFVVVVIRRSRRHREILKTGLGNRGNWCSCSAQPTKSTQRSDYSVVTVHMYEYEFYQWFTQAISKWHSTEVLLFKRQTSLPLSCLTQNNKKDSKYGTIMIPEKVSVGCQISTNRIERIIIIWIYLSLLKTTILSATVGLRQIRYVC